MKKFRLLIIALVTVSLFNTCQKDKTPAETNLTVLITRHPTGGIQVNSVSVYFTGEVLGNITPVSATVEWWWEDGYHSNSKLKSSTEYTFNSSSTTSKTTVWSADSGYILLNYYWVKIRWTDDNGDHLLESSKAYCKRE